MSLPNVWIFAACVRHIAGKVVHKRGTDALQMQPSNPVVLITVLWKRVGIFEGYLWSPLKEIPLFVTIDKGLGAARAQSSLLRSSFLWFPLSKGRCCLLAACALTPGGEEVLSLHALTRDSWHPACHCQLQHRPLPALG